MSRRRHTLSNTGRVISLLSICGLVAITGCSSSGGSGSSSSGASSAAPTSCQSGSALKPVSLTVQGEGLAFNSVLPQVMKQMGYFKDENLNVDVTVASNPGTADAGLVSGAVDIYLGGTDALIAISKGAPLEFVASGGNGSVFNIVTAKDIKSPAQLKGKSFAVSSPTSISTVVAKEALKAKGLSSSDVHYVVAGTSNNRYKALVAGQVQAATLSPGLIQKAEDAGYNNLGNTTKLGAPPIVTDITTVNKNWASSHQDALVRYLEAMQRLTNDLYNKAKWPALTAAFSKILNDPQPIVKQIFQTQFGNGGDGTLPKDMSIELAGVQNSLKAYNQLGTISSKVDVASTINSKYLKLAQHCVPPVS